MTALTIVLDAIIVVLVAFTILAARASTWYGQQARLWLTNPNEARARETAKPAAVRAYEAITRKTRR